MKRSLALVLPLVAAACTGDPLVFQEEEYQTAIGGTEQYLGGGCAPLGEGSEVSTGTAGGTSAKDGFAYTITATGQDRGVRVLVSDENGAKLVTRSYDEMFLLSEKRDEISVELRAGVLRLVVWGGLECEPVKEPDVD